MDYNSKYTGEQVEDLLDKINGSPEDIAIPTGNYPDMTVGKASQADTATRAINADNATNATKATTADYATTAGAAESAEHANTAESAIHAAKATKADFATDLTGRVEATPEVFTYRPSAGEKSIKDDNAFIRRVKGNSVVWNQLVKNGDFASADNWASNDKNSTTLTIEEGKAVVTSKYAGTGGDPVAIRQTLPPSVANHKYFVSLDFSANNTDLTPYFEYYRAFSGYAESMFRDGNTYSSIFTAKESGATVFLLKPQGTKAVGDVWEWDNVMVIDLTAMFGAGNEPTTVDEFRALYPDSYYPYNAGELRNLDCSGIKTMGFNQWDEQWERGSLNSVGENDDTSTTIRSKNYTPAIGGTNYYVGIASEGYDNIYYLGISWYDSNKQFISKSYCNQRVVTSPVNAAYFRIFTNTNSYVYGNTYNNDICISLHHTGWRDGEYEPYKEVTHSLPLSQITNGEPLRKAGSVFDEINETHYIKRVGVRPYAEGDENDATLLTDGTNTNYPRVEPIVTPIETPIDFNYYVEDFGTEEALLTEGSAPFSADIVYQFNATDQIRNNTRNINKLQKSALIPRGTSAQYIRGDGSYGDIVELSQSTPINNGEFEITDEGNRQFILTPNYYARSQVTLDNTTTIAVFVTAPEDSNYLAEYWFEFAVDDTLPNIEYYQPNNSDAIFRIDGDMMTDAVNILHLISSDGGETFFGEIRSYSL